MLPRGPRLCSLVVVVREPLGSQEGGSCSVGAAASTQDHLSDERVNKQKGMMGKRGNKPPLSLNGGCGGHCSSWLSREWPLSYKPPLLSLRGWSFQTTVPGQDRVSWCLWVPSVT